MASYSVENCDVSTLYPKVVLPTPLSPSITTLYCFHSFRGDSAAGFEDATPGFTASWYD